MSMPDEKDYVSDKVRDQAGGLGLNTGKVSAWGVPNLREEFEVSMIYGWVGGK